MLPKVGEAETLNLVTNPHRFSMCNGLEFLGTSGQNVHDMRLYSKLDPQPTAALKLLLEMQHVCPTSPDTLRSFPFRQDDPFVVQSAPHVFFAGCQPAYGEEVVYRDEACDSLVKLLCIPTFALSRSIVLLDTVTLQSYELRFGEPLTLMKQ